LSISESLGTFPATFTYERVGICGNAIGEGIFFNAEPSDCQSSRGEKACIPELLEATVSQWQKHGIQTLLSMIPLLSQTFLSLRD
jgi:hypothetical protein